MSHHVRCWGYKLNRTDLNKKRVMKISAVLPGFILSHTTQNPWMQIVFLFNAPQGGSYY